MSEISLTIKQRDGLLSLLGWLFIKVSIKVLTDPILNNINMNVKMAKLESIKIVGRNERHNLKWMPLITQNESKAALTRVKEVDEL